MKRFTLTPHRHTTRSPRQIGRLARLALPLSLSAALWTAHAATGQVETMKPAMPADKPDSVLVLMATRVESDPGFANGCWVRLYDGTGFRGDQLTLMGPIEMPRMTRTGTSWLDWDSAIVGPKARVTVYGGRDFKNRRAGLEPNQRVADMNAEGFGSFADINSVQVNCSTS